MIIHAYKTHKITVGDELFAVLDTYLPKLEEKSIIVITSKIVSICQGDVVPNDGRITKEALVKREADYYLENNHRYGTVIPTIKNGMLIVNAGIDESNANGDFILWPKNLEQTTARTWDYLRKKHKIHDLGIIITDSRTTPLRWGINALGIDWCGFQALKDYRGEPDIFGRIIKMEQQSLLDGFAYAATLVMGEGPEQTPLSIVKDIPFVTFQDRPPSQAERDLMQIEKEDDIYGQMLTSVDWKKGKKT